MTILEHINDNYDSMSKVYRRIADYIKDKSSSLAFVRLEDLAEQIGVSTTSVIRFVRLLGYSGYSALQKEIQNDIMKKVSLPERLDDAIKHVKQDSLLNDVYKTSVENLQATMDAFDPATFQSATRTIIEAKRLYVLGSRTTFGLAHYLVSNLCFLHNNVQFLSGIGGLYPEEILNIGKGDVCISFMFPRYQKMMSNMLSWMKKHGAKVILFTSISYEPIRNLGDIFLCSKTQRLAAKDSFLSTVFLIECLLTSVMINSDYKITKN